MLLSKLFGDPNKRVINQLKPIIEKINQLEKAFETLSDEQLKNKTSEFKERLKKGEKLDDLLFEAFAAAREASRRTIKLRHFDVQLLGGIILHRGQITEMKTGEGKTLVATLPVYLNALEGKGCHLVTVNDYLARRDAEWMGKIYNFLGLSVGVLNHEKAYYYKPIENRTTHLGSGEELEEVERKQAYLADITYGTNNEFGFDFLRDNMVNDPKQKVQREPHYAIIDEVDSILIDEARTPLIISAPEEEASKTYYQFAEVVGRLQENADFNIDEKMRAATFTDQGSARIAQLLGRDPWKENDLDAAYHLEAALRARTLFHRDRDYVVKPAPTGASGDGEVIIVDEFTGRLMFGRRYSEGLHQAIEAKEKVDIKRESQTLATITFQNLFRMYKKLAGMTGTALTEAEEFSKIYNLEVVVIPTNKPLIRLEMPDWIYKNENAKWKAIVEGIKVCHQKGQPVLVGTISIEKNELLAELLSREGVSCQILNAKNHEKEAEILAQAGRKGAVTVATNMAGRGVDIVLGGNSPSKFKVQNSKLKAINEESEEFKEWKRGHDEVIALGGLHVVGTERHESRRIDNQLRGRSGRQGDPGSSQFFLSLDDDLMRVFGSSRLKGIMNRLGLPEDMPIEHRMISSSIEAAQRKVEGHHFDSRKYLLEYDDVLNRHREIFYKKREEAIKISCLREKIFEMVEKEIERVVLFHTASKNEKEWNLEEIFEAVNTIYPLPAEAREKFKNLQGFAGDEPHDVAARTRIIEYLFELTSLAYKNLEERVKETNPELMRHIEKAVMLRVMDTLWVEHLSAIDYLRTGIGLRGYGQRDPLVEYKREAYRLFTDLLASLEKQVVYMIFKFTEAQLAAHAAASMESSLLKRRGLTFSAPSKEMQKGQAGAGIVKERPRAASGEKIGRNDPCPCGSGKKYKRCHGA